MRSNDPRYPGKTAPRRSLRNHLIALWTRARLGDGRYRFIAHDEALCRLRRNEGRICRDLWPRVDMETSTLGCGLGYSNAWSARKRTMVNPSGFTANALFWTFSRKT